MGQNGSKWVKMGQNRVKIGSKWVKMGQNGSKWLNMGQNGVKMGSKWVKMGQNRLKMAQNGSKWVKMGQNGVKMGRSKWVKMGQNSVNIAQNRVNTASSSREVGIERAQQGKLLKMAQNPRSTGGGGMERAPHGGYGARSTWGVWSALHRGVGVWSALHRRGVWSANSKILVTCFSLVFSRMGTLFQIRAPLRPLWAPLGPSRSL